MQQIDVKLAANAINETNGEELYKVLLTSCVFRVYVRCLVDSIHDVCFTVLTFTVLFHLRDECPNIGTMYARDFFTQPRRY